jgi:hypothetical protein
LDGGVYIDTILVLSKDKPKEVPEFKSSQEPQIYPVDPILLGQDLAIPSERILDLLILVKSMDFWDNYFSGTA